jgi:hypothetical protein
LPIFQILERVLNEEDYGSIIWQFNISSSSTDITIETLEGRGWKLTGGCRRRYDGKTCFPNLFQKSPSHLANYVIDTVDNDLSTTDSILASMRIETVRLLNQKNNRLEIVLVRFSEMNPSVTYDYLWCMDAKTSLNLDAALSTLEFR